MRSLYLDLQSVFINKESPLCTRTRISRKKALKAFQGEIALARGKNPSPRVRLLQACGVVNLAFASFKRVRSPHLAPQRPFPRLHELTPTLNVPYSQLTVWKLHCEALVQFYSSPP